MQMLEDNYERNVGRWQVEKFFGWATAD
jgi:hypothetical protein